MGRQPSLWREPAWWALLAAALLYCAWLGSHWLRLDWGPNELSASASRVWDVKKELAAGNGLPWWTPWFMSGSSYGLNHSRGLYLIPWGILASWFDLATAGKLMCLGAIFLGAIGMFFCARRLLQHPWAACLAAIAYLLHPEQVIRAAGAEHITISLSFGFVPLLWLAFVRALESARLRDIVVCGLVAAGFAFADTKQALVHGVFLVGYLVYWCWPAARRAQWPSVARTCVLIGCAAALLGAAVIIPGVTEQRLVKVFVNEPLAEWQKAYSFKSLLALTDRDGVAARAAAAGVQQALQAQQYRPRSEAEARELQADISRIFAMGSESPEKYMGFVLLAALAVTALWNNRRQNRSLFWTLVGLLMLSVTLATAETNVLAANWKTASALFGLPGVGGTARFIGLLALAAAGYGLVLFWNRKLQTPARRKLGLAVLAAFLLVPGFKLISALPLFGDIRAPFVFYDGPAMFLGSLLLGFLVTDVLQESRWRARVPACCGVMGLLLLLDYWPYQRPAKHHDVPARTIANLKAAYAALAKDPDPVKTYSVSSRYFHLLGPMYSGKPQVYEAFYNWMAPLGTGLLNQQAFSSWGNHRAFLNLMGARYIVYDKTDPANQRNQQLDAMYRQSYPVAIENEDFVVWRNDSAHAYVTAYERACLFTGELGDSVTLSLSLAAAGWPLVQGSGSTTGAFARTYSGSTGALLPSQPAPRVNLSDLQLERPRHGLIRIRATVPTACTMVIAESFYPFWKASIDGAPAPLQRVSTALMGLDLAAGRHEVILRYEPPRAYGAAVWLSAFTWLVALAFVGVAYSRQRAA